MAEIKSRGRRGILFSVSAMLLGISLLFFSFYLSEQSARAKQTVALLVQSDRTAEAYGNAQSEIAHILSSSMNISVSGNGIYISESLPLSGTLAGDLDKFAQFENNFSDFGTSMNLTNAKAGSFLVQPGGTAITQTATDFYITPANSPDGSASLSSYSVNLTFPALDVDGAAWDAISNSSANSSQMPVHVRVQDASYSFNADFASAVDKNGTSILNITQGGNLVGYVKFYPPAAMQVHYAGNIGLKASIGFSNPIYVEANDTLAVSSAVNRTGRVRIA